MATPEEREHLIGTALMRDSSFREWLFKDPQSAAASVGIKLSDVEAAQIRSFDAGAFEKASQNVQEIVSPPKIEWGG